MTEKEKIIVRKNEEFNGLEIKFPSKPPQDVIDLLKEKKFRWNRKVSVWYTKWNEELFQEMSDRFVE
jgi:hypothetical protein